MTRPTIKGLGEIALRVTDLDAMQRFYTEVLGLELLRRFEKAAFFQIAEGHGGHVQVLALFDRAGEPDYVPPDDARTTVDHIAFDIDRADYDPELARLRGLGLEVTTTEHAWVHWRSLYLRDPEGNEVELVCYDNTVN